VYDCQQKAVHGTISNKVAMLGEINASTQPYDLLFADIRQDIFEMIQGMILCIPNIKEFVQRL